MDEVFRSKFHFQEHTEELTHELTQPSEDLILERNAELRKNPGVVKDLGKGNEGGTWGRMLCSIPLVMFEKAIRDGYQLNATDAQFKSEEIHRYLKSEEGKKCLVN